MKNDALTNDGASKNKAEMFTKPLKDGRVEYIEREVERFNFEGYQVVRRELFSKANCPAVTLKYGHINFNIRAIRKFEACSHIQILMNATRKEMIAMPSEEDVKNSVQWSKVDKLGKVVPRKITGRHFTAQLFDDMNWNPDGTYKCLGTLIRNEHTGKVLFVFELINAESYDSLSAPSEDDPNRRERIPLIPIHWQGNYGQSYEENQKQMLTTLEKSSEGFVRVKLLPILPKVKKDKKKKGDQDGAV